MKDLNEIRNEIDTIDQKMRALFEERMDCVMSVAEYKYKNNEKIFDSTREENVIIKNLEHLENQDYRESYEKFLHALMDESKAFQKHWIDAQKKEEK
ncbi:MAG: chorismate mutase [Eubacteriaceae bacterium]